MLLKTIDLGFLYEKIDLGLRRNGMTFDYIFDKPSTKMQLLAMKKTSEIKKNEFDRSQIVS